MNILLQGVEQQASDIFLVAGLPLTYKRSGTLQHQTHQPLSAEQTHALVLELFELARGRNPSPLLENGDDDFSFSLKGISRFRVSAYRQRGSLAAVIRVLPFDLPNPQVLGIPQQVLDLSQRTRGLVLITGPAGSGKSTTLACMIDQINHRRSCHVITLEDPIEYLHSHNHSIVSQREVTSDTLSYVTALRAALRQSPDVILLGEMRDSETIATAMTAAETGHLVLSTLHTTGAANTIDRIIDAFPPSQQPQIRVQLSMVLQAVVSQQLLPTVDGEMAPAFEILLCNTAIRNMIREAKIHQIDTAIFSSSNEGMVTMDTSILSLWQQGRITARDAVIYSVRPDSMAKKVGLPL